MKLIFKLAVCTLIAGHCLIAAAQSRAISYDKMIDTIREASLVSVDVHAAKIGSSSSKSHGVWVVHLGRNDDRKAPKIRILFICRQHGDEPASTIAATSIIQTFANNLKSLPGRAFSRADIYIVPMANPDGAMHDTRVSGDGADLNRDWGTFRQPETRAIYRLALAIRPDFVVDCHSWDLGDHYDHACIEAPRGTSSDLLVSTCSRIQRDAIGSIAAMDSKAVLPTSYGSSATAGLCHRFFAQEMKIPSVLFETSPAGTSSLSVDHRAKLAYDAIVSLVLAATRNSQALVALRQHRSQVSPPAGFRVVYTDWKPAAANTRPVVAATYLGGGSPGDALLLLAVLAVLILTGTRFMTTAQATFSLEEIRARRNAEALRSDLSGISRIEWQDVTAYRHGLGYRRLGLRQPAK